MPYCPKCDMEFIDGITVCSDCKGPLVESEAVAKKMRIKAMQEAQAQEEAQMKDLQKQWAKSIGVENPDDVDLNALAAASAPKPAKAYVSKSQKLSDLKSSASAFFGVGGVMTVLSLLAWTGVLPLPLYGTGKYLTFGVMTVMGLGCLYIGYTTLKSAKEVAGQVDDEKKQTEEIIDWFVTNVSRTKMDAKINHDFGAIAPEEKSLKRFAIIHDILIVEKGITDQDYIDLLAEEIYNRMFEN